MFKEKIIELANREDLKATEKSLNQTQRNVIASELLDSLYSDLSEKIIGAKTEENSMYATREYVNIGRIENAIEIEVDNEYIGFIPIKISLSIPNFSDESLIEKVVAWTEKKQKKEQMKIEKEKVRAERKATK